MRPYESYGLGDRYLVIHLLSKDPGAYCVSTVATDTCECRSPWKPKVLGVPRVKLTGGRGSPE